MKILRLLGFTLIILGMFLGNTVSAREFSLADFSGFYAWVYEGSISVVDPSTQQPQIIPIASVGQVVSSGTDSDEDGWGEFTVSSVTINIGGLILLNFGSTDLDVPRYAVNSTTGVGFSSAPVVLTKPPTFPLGATAIPPGIDASAFIGSTAVFTHAFVIQADGTVNIIGTTFSTKDSSGQTTLIPTIGVGTLKRQESESTQ